MQCSAVCVYGGSRLQHVLRLPVESSTSWCSDGVQYHRFNINAKADVS